MDAHTISVSLNVVALISGGKDSMFSLLHCLANGHKIVALANLYPPLEECGPNHTQKDNGTQPVPWDRDVDSYMYQTAGHNLVPLYADALGLPLYRHSISGGALDSSKSYTPHGRLDDETEALVPLLKEVLRFHPTANAVSSGAILSTYQRTRIESVAVRLGLVSLSYLWQYPSLPLPQHSGHNDPQSALLRDMAEAGFDSRIIKVATGGLDDSLLWSNLMTTQIREKVEKAVNRFGGSVLGEGGEYETMVVEGPANVVVVKTPVDARNYAYRNMPDEPKRISNIWRGRIHVAETAMRRTNEGGLAFKEEGGTIVRFRDTIAEGNIRIPKLWDEDFETILEKMRNLDSTWNDSPGPTAATQVLKGESSSSLDYLSCDGEVASCQSNGTNTHFRNGKCQVGNNYVISNLTSSNNGISIDAQMLGINEELLSVLKVLDRPTSSIAFTTIILRSMSDFPMVNIVYGKLFSEPNPPARVTFACVLPLGIDIVVSVVVNMNANIDALHVQSRSYWAPANIGPYSQAVSVPLSIDFPPTFVFVAGQIPLVPATMEIVECTPNFHADRALDGYRLDCCLALQHLWRIGKDREVDWWTGAVAFIVRGDKPNAKAFMAWAAWREVHEPRLWKESEVKDDDAYDVWDTTYGLHSSSFVATDRVHRLPNFEKMVFEQDEQHPSPYDRNQMTYPESQDFENPKVPGFFAIEVDGLPRSSEIEWQSLGIAHSEVKLTTHYVGEHGYCQFQARSCSVSSLRRVVSYIEIPFVPISEPQLRKSNISSGIDWVRNVAASSEEVHITIYTPDVSLVTDIDAQIVPCHTIWGPGGKRLAAGIVVNFDMKDGRYL